MSDQEYITQFDLLTDFLELADELGGQAVIDGSAWPTEMILEAIPQTEEQNS